MYALRIIKYLKDIISSSSVVKIGILMYNKNIKITLCKCELNSCIKTIMKNLYSVLKHY